MNENFFARIGTTAIVNQKAKEVIANGGTVTRDKSAGTVVANFGSDVIFKAIRKGHGQPWIVMYSPRYYPKN